MARKDCSRTHQSKCITHRRVVLRVPLPPPACRRRFRAQRRREKQKAGKAELMNPSRPFILRPIATSLLMAAILLAGAVAYRQLPVSALPQVDYPTIQVLTFYPGASPSVMASS